MYLKFAPNNERVAMTKNYPNTGFTGLDFKTGTDSPKPPPLCVRLSKQSYFDLEQAGQKNHCPGPHPEGSRPEPSHGICLLFFFFLSRGLSYQADQRLQSVRQHKWQSDRTMDGKAGGRNRSETEPTGFITERKIAQMFSLNKVYILQNDTATSRRDGVRQVAFGRC